MSYENALINIYNIRETNFILQPVSQFHAHLRKIVTMLYVKHNCTFLNIEQLHV
jgi:hypothetical protein